MNLEQHITVTRIDVEFQIDGTKVSLLDFLKPNLSFEKALEYIYTDAMQRMADSLEQSLILSQPSSVFLPKKKKRTKT